jgi:hypothetical protein
MIDWRRHRKPIYVETLVRAPLEALWDATQDPEQHRRWDVRFGSITHQVRHDGGPQRFTYATRILPMGFTVAGTGEALGDRDRSDGSRWSGLRFWATDRRSIIEAGAGYWRYVPVAEGVRFLTRYDYRPRWGRPGNAIDRIVFRPLFGWATAWSFDRLRLWLEEGTPPERSRDLALAHGAAVAGLVGIWSYQGAVPKLWKVDPGEVRMWESLGLEPGAARAAVRGLGAAEIGVSVLILANSARRWPFALMMIALPVLALGAGRLDKGSLSRAFNPVSLNFGAAALAGVAVATCDGRPSGRRPRRRAPDHQPEVGELP